MSPYYRDESQQSLGSARRAGWARASSSLSAAMLATHAARAQTSASVSLVSEYSVRGVSLSDRLAGAAVQPGLGLRNKAGTPALSRPRGLHLAERSGVTQLVAYGGYARRLASGLSWEAGASSTTFRNAVRIQLPRSLCRAGVRPHQRPDLPVALLLRLWRARRVRRAERLPSAARRIKLIGHIGLLHGLRGPLAEARDRVDLRLAIGLDAGACNIQLAWLGSASVGPGAATYVRTPRALALSASYSF